MNDEREAFNAAVKAAMAPQSLRVMHKAIVVDQDADGNLGVKLTENGAPSDTAKPVPLWLGLPCFFAKVKPNIQVSLGFHNGAENGAFAALFPTYPQGEAQALPDDAPLPTLPIEYLSFGAGNKPIAREGDTVSLGSIRLTNTPPAPGPIPTGFIIERILADGTVIPLGAVVGPLAVAPTPLTIPLDGVITSGREEFRA